LIDVSPKSPVMLPDDYLRKMRQDIGEVEAQVEAETRCEPGPDDPENRDRSAPQRHQDTKGFRTNIGFRTDPPPDDDPWNRDRSAPQRHQDTKGFRTNIGFRTDPPPDDDPSA